MPELITGTSNPVVLLPPPPSRLVEAARLAARAWDVPPGPGVLESELMSPDSVAMAALDAERPSGPLAGVATATLLGGGVATSDDTIVAYGWEGRGIGRLLLDALMKRLKRYGVKRVHGQASERRIGSLPVFMR